MKSEIDIVKFENEDYKNDIKSAKVREEEYKKKITKLREQETLLNARLESH